MSQSGTIAAAILAAFVIWLAANNRLVAYTDVLWGPTAKPVPSDKTSPMLPGPGLPEGGPGGVPALPGGGGPGLLQDLGPTLLEHSGDIAALLEFIP